jgi:hypothetical protein
MKDKLRPFATLVVALLYVALVIGAPLLVRYGPQPEIGSTVVHTSLPSK